MKTYESKGLISPFQRESVVARIVGCSLDRNECDFLPSVFHEEFSVAGKGGQWLGERTLALDEGADVETRGDL
jgi:hypothetical protein